MRKNVLGIYFAARKNAILSMNLRPFLMKLLRDQPNSKFCGKVITYHWTYLPAIVYFFIFIEHKTSEYAAYDNTYLLNLTMRTLYSIHLHTCGESSCYDP